MTEWSLNEQGFITSWVISGPLALPYSSTLRDPNPLHYEPALRRQIARHTPIDCAALDVHAPSSLGLPWRLLCGEDCALINLSDFYATMQDVRFQAATVIRSDADRTAQAILWSYTAVDLYLNGQKVTQIDFPVYKPISRISFSLNLRRGDNLLLLACETLGVRDTRSVAGVQFTDKSGLTVTLPDPDLADQAGRALQVLQSASIEGDDLVIRDSVPANTRFREVHFEPDFSKVHQPPLWHPVKGVGRYPLAEEDVCIRLDVPAGDAVLSRIFERTEKIRPQTIHPCPTFDENLDIIYRRIAAVESLTRSDTFGFPIANMLAREYTGTKTAHDRELLLETLSLIEQRVDCADFLLCGLIRYIRNYPVTDREMARIRQVLTGFRYWMDQDGFDGMCFWSENHCLMFYISAMNAGELFPDDRFTLAGMDGRALQAWGKGKILEWLKDVETYGFEEFNSTVYTCVTFAALLNVIDFTPPEISSRAAALTDRLLETLAMHTFRGGIISPQGRVYRGVLYPFDAGAMALMNLLDPAQPYSYGEGWLAFLATSSYRIPVHLKEQMSAVLSTVYSSGNARIVLEKQQDYCLTSVLCTGETPRRWENAALLPDADPSSHDFVKGYNECFHGTTFFQPGVYGYQQHLWMAALDSAAILFVNHPGSFSEGGDLRPGYWHGNGVFPALRQEKNLIGMIYVIPESHPVPFVHLYFPECRFDEIRRTQDWTLARRETGYVAFWSSEKTVPWTGENAHCEQRINGRNIACLCLCAGREYSSMDAFEAHVAALHPEYDPQALCLTLDSFTLRYTKGEDNTQYL